MVKFYLPYEQVVHHLNLSPLQPQNNQAPWIFPNVQTATVTEINHKQHQSIAAESRIEPWIHYWKGGHCTHHSANPTQYWTNYCTFTEDFNKTIIITLRTRNKSKTKLAMWHWKSIEYSGQWGGKVQCYNKLSEC